MENYACAGVILFNVEKHSDQMKIGSLNMIETLFQLQKVIKHMLIGKFKILITFAGWLMNFKLYGYMKWQEKYQYLYNMKKIKKNQIVDAIRACLMNVDFLHFAGSWHRI